MKLKPTFGPKLSETFHFFSFLYYFLQVSFGWRGKERQRFQLFESATYGGSDLLFKDTTDKLSVLMDDMDMSQVLGLDYVALLKGLGHEGEKWLLLYE